MKDLNSSRHDTVHKDKYDKYAGAARAAIIPHLKGEIHRQQSHDHSGVLSQGLAKKPLSNGETV